jgi:hypothetical protein
MEDIILLSETGRYCSQTPLGQAKVSSMQKSALLAEEREIDLCSAMNPIFATSQGNFLVA